MSNHDEVQLFYNPRSRSAMVRLLLEELQAPYRLTMIDLDKNEQRAPEFLAINPMGKLPTIIHQGQVVTETAAIFLYLADAFGMGRLAPAIDDPARAAYLRWMVFYTGCIEPAVADRALKRDPGERAMSPYGDFETMLKTMRGALLPGPYILGERFTAADVLWGSALDWMLTFGMLPEDPIVGAYVERHRARQTVQALKAQE